MEGRGNCGSESEGEGSVVVAMVFLLFDGWSSSCCIKGRGGGVICWVLLSGWNSLPFNSGDSSRPFFAKGGMSKVVFSLLIGGDK